MGNSEAKKVDLKEKVKVVATKDHPFYKPNEEFYCGVVTKETLKKKGFIVTDKKAAKEEAAKA